MQVYDFKVLLEPDEAGGYVVCCPAIPGCRSQGETVAAFGFGRSDAPVASGYSRTAEDEARDRAVRERERVLALREQEMAAREREIAEQRRVLSEQYRILRSRPAEPAPAPAARGSAPVGTPTRTWPPAAPAAAKRFDTTRRRPRTFWSRVKQTLLGVTEPILEDSL